MVIIMINDAIQYNGIIQPCWNTKTAHQNLFLDVRGGKNMNKELSMG